jgi:hypothetical protein
MVLGFQRFRFLKVNIASHTVLDLSMSEATPERGLIENHIRIAPWSQSVDFEFFFAIFVVMNVLHYLSYNSTLYYIAINIRPIGYTYIYRNT